jgi:hypothetical protein
MIGVDLSEFDKKKYYDLILKSSMDFIDKIGMDDSVRETLFPCKVLIFELLQESQKDFDFLLQRRLKDGVNIYKLCGILLWRFGRSNFIKLNNNSTICKEYNKSPLFYLNFNITIMLIFKEILKIDDAKPLIQLYKTEINELRYLLLHRHTNQEMIGLYLQILLKKSVL